MLVLSSGAARIVGQPNACDGISCEYNAVATPPAGFPDPQEAPDCPPLEICQMTRDLQRLARDFQKHALLRVDNGGLLRPVLKELGVKEIEALEQGCGRHVVRMVDQVFRHPGCP